MVQLHGLRNYSPCRKHYVSRGKLELTKEGIKLTAEKGADSLVEGKRAHAGRAERNSAELPPRKPGIPALIPLSTLLVFNNL